MHQQVSLVSWTQKDCPAIKQPHPSTRCLFTCEGAPGVLAEVSAALHSMKADLLQAKTERIKVSLLPATALEDS